MRTQLILIIVSAMLLFGCHTTNLSQLRPYTNDLLGAVLDPPTKINDFTLDSTLGDPFTLSDYEGEIVLLFFGYLTCPDYCPLTLAEMTQVFKGLDQPVDRVNVVFVTVDPERDSLEKMAAYLTRFNEHFIGIRAEDEPLQQLMDQFGAIAEKQAPTNISGVYLVDHTASVFLIDTQGRLAVQYLYGTDYRDIIHDLEIILNA